MIPAVNPRLVTISESLKIENGCWIWQRSKTKDGYGQCRFSKGKKEGVHRIMYGVFVGPIPKHLEIDHLCRNRACCNPEHLEAVTHAENIRRGDKTNIGRTNRDKTHCVGGHLLSGENLYLDTRGARQCKACRAAASNMSYYRRRYE